MSLKGLRKRIRRLVKAAPNRPVESGAPLSLPFSKTSEIRNAQGEVSADIDLVKSAVESGQYRVVDDRADFLLLEIKVGVRSAWACLKPKPRESPVFLVLSVHIVDVVHSEAIMKSLRAFSAGARSFSETGTG